MKQKLPSHLKICATCNKWSGERTPVPPLYAWVEFDHQGRGRCCGGAFDRAERNAMCTCPKWEQQYGKK